MNIMGSVYKQLGDKDQAHKLYQEAYEIYLQSVGSSHPDTQKAAQDLQSLTI